MLLEGLILVIGLFFLESRYQVFSQSGTKILKVLQGDLTVNMNNIYGDNHVESTEKVYVDMEMFEKDQEEYIMIARDPVLNRKYREDGVVAFSMVDVTDSAEIFRVSLKSE